MTKIEKLLFQLTIFLIPTNLAYHWITQESYLSGLLVDYLIPKLYLSDLPIIILLFLWLNNLLPKLRKLKLNSIKNNSLLLPTTFFSILFIRGVFSSVPIASTWFLLKTIKLVLFFLWITHHLTLPKLKSLLPTPISLALIFQALLGLYQFIAQRSLAGYYFFGETILEYSTAIAKSPLFGLTPLEKEIPRILPYGTTPHPNVLSGFLALGIILLWLSTRGKYIQKLYQILLISISYSLSFVTFFLTQTISAWFAPLLGITLIRSLKTSSSRTKILLIVLAISIVTALSLPINIKSIPPIPPNNPISSSIIRRFKLNQISWNMILSHPLFGVGLNNFTAEMSKFGEVPSPTRFLQPAHNIYLLILAESGLIGLLPILYFIFLVKTKRIKVKPKTYPTIYTLPLITLLLIGLLDHYPITLQQGQLLLVFSASIALIKK